MTQDESSAAPFTMPSWIAKVLRGIVSVVLCAMMFLIFVDVFFRYFFNSPIPGSFEIVRFMMAILIFSALPLVSGSEGHIVVGLFDDVFRGRVGRVRRVVVGLVSATALAVIAYLLVLQGQSLARFGKVTGYLDLPLSPLAYALAFFAFATMCVQLALTWHHLTAADDDR